MENRRKKLPDDRFKKKRQPLQKPGTFRLFLGVFVPEEYREYFRNVLRELDKQKRNLKLVPVDQLHVTVKFIGPEVSASSKDELVRRLQSLSGQFPKPIIKIKPVQMGFPYQKDPTHILAEVENNPDLIEISNAVLSILKDLRLEDTVRWKLKHSNSFHVVIARTKFHASKSIGREVKDLINKVKIMPPEPFQPEYIDLVESQTTPEGPVYRKIANIKL